MRAIVIGAGIAGLSTALALRRIGIDVQVYERAPELKEVGAGISLWANALRGLDSLGVGSHVREASFPLRVSEFRLRNGHTIAATFHADRFEKAVGYTPFIAMIHRAELLAILGRQLPEGTVRLGHTCVGIEQVGSMPKVMFENGQSDTADFVVAADGLRSVVRELFLGRVSPRYAGYTCFRGVCARPETVSPGYLAEWWGKGRRFGITTLKHDRVYWWATRNQPVGQQHANNRDVLLNAFENWVEPVPSLISMTPAESILQNDLFDRPPTRRWVTGRVLMVGDAAHPMTPNLGQGGCTAIEDAVVLARVLAADSDVDTAFKEFVAERYGRTTAITNESRRFGAIGQWEGGLVTWLRDVVYGFGLPYAAPSILPQHAKYDAGVLAARCG